MKNKTSKGIKEDQNLLNRKRINEEEQKSSSVKNLNQNKISKNPTEVNIVTDSNQDKSNISIQICSDVKGNKNHTKANENFSLKNDSNLEFLSEREKNKNYKNACKSKLIPSKVSPEEVPNILDKQESQDTACSKKGDPLFKIINEESTIHDKTELNFLSKQESAQSQNFPSQGKEKSESHHQLKNTLTLEQIQDYNNIMKKFSKSNDTDEPEKPKKSELCKICKFHNSNKLNKCDYCKNNVHIKCFMDNLNYAIKGNISCSRCLGEILHEVQVMSSTNVVEQDRLNYPRNEQQFASNATTMKNSIDDYMNTMLKNSIGKLSTAGNNSNMNRQRNEYFNLLNLIQDKGQNCIPYDSQSNILNLASKLQNPNRQNNNWDNSFMTNPLGFMQNNNFSFSPDDFNNMSGLNLNQFWPINNITNISNNITNNNFQINPFALDLNAISQFLSNLNSNQINRVDNSNLLQLMLNEGNNSQLGSLLGNLLQNQNVSQNLKTTKESTNKSYMANVTNVVKSNRTDETQSKAELTRKSTSVDKPESKSKSNMKAVPSFIPYPDKIIIEDHKLLEDPEKYNIKLSSMLEVRKLI